jgi:drug/metabolite transporter (DMT)-like permease
MARDATAEPPADAVRAHGVHASTAARAWLGPLFAVVGVLGFSFKAILIKLAYRYAPADPVALLTLRMLYAAPFFLAMAWWSGRAPGAKPIGASDMRLLVGLGFIGYYLSSLLDFMGLQYVTASLERLVLFLYPTIVVVLSAIFLAKPVTRRAGAALVLSYAGIALAVWHDVRITGDAPTIALAARSCSRARSGMRAISSARVASSRASARRASLPGRCSPPRCSSPSNSR